jgi:hypothetical protein
MATRKYFEFDEESNSNDLQQARLLNPSRDSEENEFFLNEKDLDDTDYSFQKKVTIVIN